MSSRIIRKLSIGGTYHKDTTHYQMGTPQGVGSKRHQISRIKLNERLFATKGERVYEIWLLDVVEKEEYCWKTVGVGNLSWTEEHDLDF